MGQRISEPQRPGTIYKAPPVISNGRLPLQKTGHDRMFNCAAAPVELRGGYAYLRSETANR
jgi:hypothetical protein